MLLGMKKILTVTLLYMGLTFSVQAEVYKWTDEAGNIIYSDRPQPGVEKIEEIDVTKGTYYTPPTLPAIKPPAATTKKEPPVYEIVEIRQPQQDDTIRDNQGYVQVSLRTVPDLKQDHSYQLYLDGEPIYDPFVYNVVRIPNVDRGSHSLEVRIVDADGAEITASEPVTFHLHRASARINQERRRRPPRQPKPTPRPTPTPFGG